MVGQMDREAVEAVRDTRAARAPRREVGSKHEVIDEELRASPEEIGEGRFALVGLEAIVLVDSNPGQLLPPSSELVATLGQGFLGLQQLEPRRKPLLTCASLVFRHYFSPSCSDGSCLFLALVT